MTFGEILLSMLYKAQVQKDKIDDALRDVSESDALALMRGRWHDDVSTHHPSTLNLFKGDAQDAINDFLRRNK